MRLIFATAICAAIALPGSAADTAQQTSMKTCAATWKGMAAADKAKTKYTDYMGTCMKAGASAKTPGGTMAVAPAPAPAMAKPAMAGSMGSMKMSAPGGGSAKCKDGTTVTYKNRSGTCSGHGGVATWL